MNTPAWVQAIALLVWGAALGFGAIGIIGGAVAGGLLLVVTRARFRLRLSSNELNRVVDITALVVVASLVGMLAASGLPKGLLAAMAWLPASLLPLLLVAKLNETPLRLRHLALTLRNSTRAEADSVVQFDAPFLALTLLATAVQESFTTLRFSLLGAVLLLWLFATRPLPQTQGLIRFTTAATLALGLAWGASQGLQRSQAALQDWFIAALSGVDSDPYQSQTRIGELGRLKLSERIVWRANLAPPAEVPLRLRSGVFTRYANGTWLARHDAFSPLKNTPASLPPQLRLRGSSQNGAVLLPVPTDVAAIQGIGQVERNPLGVVRLSEAPTLLDVALGRAGPAAAPPSADDLALAPNHLALLDQLPLAALKQTSATARLEGLQAWFASEFRYTLFVGDETHGRRDIARFLLTDRAGHCEYFATATVLLLRGLGIPARYVTGYSVQEFSRLEGAFLVRQRHAHAWAEAYVDGRWVEVDTTPSTWLTTEESAAPVWQPALDFASYLWQKWGELRRWLFTGANAFWAAGVLLLAALWLAAKRFQRSAQPTAKLGAGEAAPEALSTESQALRDLERQFAARGLARHPAEPPRRWLGRVSREGSSVVDAAQLAAAGDIVARLYRRRYASAQEVGDKLQ